MLGVKKEDGSLVMLYEKYRCMMLTAAMDVLHDEFLAEDAVQNAFVSLAGNIHKIKDMDSTATKRYLIVAVQNAAIDIYRKQKKRAQREILMDEPENRNITVVYEETDTDNRVLDILKNLPPRYRDIFLLKYSACLDNAEIAKVCGLREGTVRQRIARGKKLIEEELRKQKE